MSEDESDFLSIIHVIWAADEQKERADWKRSLMVPKRQTRDVLKHVYRLYSMAFTKSYCDLLSWVEGKIEKKHRFLTTFFSLFLISICIIIWCTINLWCLLFQSGNDFILFIIQHFVNLSLNTFVILKTLCWKWTR